MYSVRLLSVFVDVYSWLCARLSFSFSFHVDSFVVFFVSFSFSLCPLSCYFYTHIAYEIASFLCNPFPNSIYTNWMKWGTEKKLRWKHGFSIHSVAFSLTSVPQSLPICNVILFHFASLFCNFEHIWLDCKQRYLCLSLDIFMNVNCNFAIAVFDKTIPFVRYGNDIPVDWIISTGFFRVSVNRSVWLVLIHPHRVTMKLVSFSFGFGPTHENQWCAAVIYGLCRKWSVMTCPGTEQFARAYFRFGSFVRFAKRTHVFPYKNRNSDNVNMESINAAHTYMCVKYKLHLIAWVSPGSFSFHLHLLFPNVVAAFAFAEYFVNVHFYKVIVASRRYAVCLNTVQHMFDYNALTTKHCVHYYL